MSTVKSTDLLAITRPSGGDAGTYKVAVSDLPQAVPATETAAGIAELATQAETDAGTDDQRIVTPLKLQAKIAAEIAGALVPATEAASGIVELATAAETTTGTDATRAVHPAGLRAVTDAERVTSDAQYVDTAGDTMTGNLDVPSLNGGPLAGMRNLLINGNPIINQRVYVSGAATSGANQYTLDRWRVVTSGQSITWTDSNNIRTVTAPAGGVEQVIERLNILSGTYTLSWTGTATATVDGSPVTNGGQVSLTGGTNATVRFSGGTFSLAQLEPGTVATPFERRSYGQELALCQRYYERGGGGDNTTTDQQFRSCYTGAFPWTVRYAVPKKANGSVTLYGESSGTVGNWRDKSADVDVVANVTLGTRSGFVSTATTIDGRVYAFTWTSSAEL